MANVTKFIANNKTFFNKDKEARDSIEEILKSKQANLIADLPLDLTDNKLSIDLSKYYTKIESDEILKNKSDELNFKIANNKKFIDIIKSYLTRLLNLNSNFENDTDIPDVSQYTEKTTQIDNTLKNLKTNIDENYETLNSKISKHIEQSDTFSKELKEAVDSKQKNLDQRMLFIEREFFGNSYEEGKITFENSLSRLDVLENKINQIYDKLLTAGLVKTENIESINK